MRPNLRHLLPLLLVLATTEMASACSVPVFAYALRRWEPDPQVLLSSRDAAWRSAVHQRFAAQEAQIRVEVAGTPASTPGVLGGDATPRSAGIYAAGAAVPWWPGEVADDRLAGIADSPLRRDLTRRLLAGAAVVWLFLGSGDAGADAGELARLRKRLAQLQATLALPVQDPEDPSTARTLAEAGPPIRLDFQVIAIDPRDGAEWALIAQVRAMAAGLAQEAAAGKADGRTGAVPVAAANALIVPVFGRARMLEARPAPDWTDAAIDAATMFLTGACSCQVKELNPGTDLLVACAWQQGLQAATVAPGPTLPAAAPVPETVVITPSAPAAPAQPAPAAPVSTRLGLLAGLAAGATALFSVFMLWRLRRLRR